MKNKTDGSRQLRRAAALAVVAGVAVLTTACGVHVHFGSGSSDPSTNAPATFSEAQELALAQCMRGHGLPGFPDPAPTGGFNANVLTLLDSSTGQTAYGACRHLLAGGGPAISQLQAQVQQAQQKLQEELPTLLKFSECIRSHGVPNYPDPALTGQGLTENTAGDFNPSAPQFQAAVSACHHLLPAGANLSAGMHESGTHRS
jgi:hypothetical protein